MITFATKIYNSSVHEDSGKIYLDILKDNWSPALTITRALKTIYRDVFEQGGDPIEKGGNNKAGLLQVNDMYAYCLKCAEYNHKYADGPLRDRFEFPSLKPDQYEKNIKVIINILYDVWKLDAGIIGVIIDELYGDEVYCCGLSGFPTEILVRGIPYQELKRIVFEEKGRSRIEMPTFGKVYIEYAGYWAKYSAKGKTEIRFGPEEVVAHLIVRFKNVKGRCLGSASICVDKEERWLKFNDPVHDLDNKTLKLYRGMGCGATEICK